MATNYPNGLGATSGSVIATDAPLYTTGGVWYVHYGTGTDAVSPRGKDDKKPLKTLRQAFTNASAGDIIVLMDGHEEPLGATAVLGDKSITIVGAGTDDDGRPTAKLLFDHADSQIIFDGAVMQIHNVWFGAAQATTAESRIRTGNVDTLFRMVDCYIECGQYDEWPVLLADGGMIWMSGVTIVSVATSESALPSYGFDAGDVSSPTSLWMDDCVFDEGDYGFAEEKAFVIMAADAIFIENLELANGADIFIELAATDGYVNAQVVSGSGKVVFTESGGE